MSEKAKVTSKSRIVQNLFRIVRLFFDIVIMVAVAIKSWIVQNLFRIVRLFFAIVIMVAVTIKSWIVQNLFRIVRLFFAIVIMVAVTINFLNIGKTLITKEISSIIITPVSKTSTKSEPFVDTVPVVTGSNKKTDPDKKIKTTENEEGTATQQVLAYALQLFAWLGLIGISLWAVVALTRDD